jgi:hypothetical protein
MLTTTRRGLDRSELVTTAAAVVISSSLYIAKGHPYLARGVVGDLVGLGLLSLVVLWERRRLRHEALLCLFCIGVVHALDPYWPLRLPGLLWWSAVTAGLAAYVAVRHRGLDGRPSGAAGGRPTQ